MTQHAAEQRCPACGAELPPQGLRCISCGAPLALVSAAGAAAEGGGDPLQAAAPETAESAAERAAGTALPVGLAPRGPWQDGTAIGLDSDASDYTPPGSEDAGQELDEASLPPEVLAILKAPEVKPTALAGLPELGGGLTWPRVLGCLIGMALLAAFALMLLWMLKNGREASVRLHRERQQLERSIDDAETGAAENEGEPPADVQGRQGGAGAEVAPDEPDSLF